MKRMKIAVVLVSMLALVGCQTLGIPIFGTDTDKDRQQAALEGAAVAAYFAYESMDHDVGSHVDHLRATLAVADDFIAKMYPEYVNWSTLVESRISDITNGQWNPQVATLYYLLFAILETTEEEAALEADSPVVAEAPL